VISLIKKLTNISKIQNNSPDQKSPYKLNGSLNPISFELPLCEASPSGKRVIFYQVIFSLLSTLKISSFSEKMVDVYNIYQTLHTVCSPLYILLYKILYSFS